MDVAVAVVWIAALSIFLLGVGERMAYPKREKKKADPLFYAGIVLIAVATAALLGWIIVRASRAGAARRLAEPLGPESEAEWVSLVPGGLLTFKAKREPPAARAWANAALRVGTVVLFSTACADAGLALHTCLANWTYAPFAATTPATAGGCLAALRALVKLVVEGSRTKYMRLHLACVAAAAASLALAIALGLALGPRFARDATDAGVFRLVAYVRCGLLAAVLAHAAVAARLRAVAGAPGPKDDVDAVEMAPRGENPMSLADEENLAPRHGGAFGDGEALVESASSASSTVERWIEAMQSGEARGR